MRDAFIGTLSELAAIDESLMVLVADNGAIVFDDYRKDYPKQFLNCGIAEANMIGFAAGLASCGKKPFAYTIANFMVLRALEQIRNDICLQKMNVKVVGIGGGLVYSTLGPTHHATEDLAIMRTLPNMTVVCPASPMEVKKATQVLSVFEGPAYFRMGTKGEEEIYLEDYDFKLGKGVLLREGNDLSLIACGPLVAEAIKAHDILKKEGIQARVINIHTLKPIDRDIILQAANETGAIITIESHQVTAGFGSAVAEVLSESHSEPILFKRLGIQDAFCSDFGKQEDLNRAVGVDARTIAMKAQGLLQCQPL